MYAIDASVHVRSTAILFASLLGPWLASLYDLGRHWAPVYLRGFFFCGMTTSQRSESLNLFFDAFVNQKTLLIQFIKQYEQATSKHHLAEVKKSAYQKQFNTSILRWSHPLAKHASTVFTAYAFELFQQQLGQANDYLYTEGINSQIIVTYRIIDETKTKTDGTNLPPQPPLPKKHQQRILQFNAQSLLIECLCRHALRVLIQKDFKKLPKCYILKQWCEDVKIIDWNAVLRATPGTAMKVKELTRIARDLIAEGSLGDEAAKVVSNGFLEIKRKLSSLHSNNVLQSDKVLQSVLQSNNIENEPPVSASVLVSKAVNPDHNAPRKGQPAAGRMKLRMERTVKPRHGNGCRAKDHSV